MTGYGWTIAALPSIASGNDLPRNPELSGEGLIPYSQRK